MAWDVTVQYIYADSHSISTSAEAGAAAMLNVTQWWTTSFGDQSKERKFRYIKIKQDSSLKEVKDRTELPWYHVLEDVTFPDTYVDSYIISTSAEAVAAAKRATAIKTTKYSDITYIHIFYQISIETAGLWDVQAVKLMEEIGRQKTAATNDHNETMYLFRRISMAIRRVSKAIQRGNALSLFHTFNNDID